VVASLRAGDTRYVLDRTAERTALVPVTGIKTVLRHDLLGVEGACPLAFVAQPVLGPLGHASGLLTQLAGDRGAELVLWDAHRTRRTQQSLHAERIRWLRLLEPSLSLQKARRLAAVALGELTGVFPHGTGGAVSVTLSFAGRLAEMGCDFEEERELARTDYFLDNDPVGASEEQVAANRRLLAEVMDLAGFCTRSNWWEFEWGTAAWAIVRGREPLLTEVLDEVTMRGPAMRPALAPHRFPRLQSGVAQPFLTADEARTSSRGSSYAYARAAHEGADALGELLTRVAFGGAGTVVCANGVVAVRCALDTALSTPGPVMSTKDIYYGSKTALLDVAGIHGVTATTSDKPLRALLADKRPRVVFVESPSNWLLRCQDVGQLAAAAHDAGALLIVDVTLQPCQPALELGADMVVCSLSKDVSLGHTLAGAIACREDSVLAHVEETVIRAGALVAPEVALTVHQQAVSLRDRLAALATKMDLVRCALTDHPAVRKVVTADLSLCGGLPGSQMGLRLHNPSVGWALERLVAQRSLDPSACLQLAGTFGAIFTTVEHFASRRLGATEESNARPTIPLDAVRVGLGCEEGPRIAAELGFMLEAALTAAEAQTPSALSRISGVPPGPR
jgi:cystathionine gamma-synthase